MRKHAKKLAKVQKKILACGGTDPKLEEKKRLLEVLIKEGTPTKVYYLLIYLLRKQKHSKRR